MAQDLRKLLEEQRTKEKFEINKGHENRFLERLDEDLPLQKKRDGMGWIGIAASVVIVLSLGVYFFINDRNGNQPDRDVQVVTKDATENVGPNDQTIEALIKNFQLQLSLIQKLKAKLNQLKSSENEQQTAII